MTHLQCSTFNCVRPRDARTLELRRTEKETEKNLRRRSEVGNQTQADLLQDSSIDLSDKILVLAQNTLC